MITENQSENTTNELLNVVADEEQATLEEENIYLEQEEDEEEFDDDGNLIIRDTEGNVIPHVPTPFEALAGLKVFCSQELTTSKLLPTEYLGVLIEPIRKIEEMLNIPNQKAFIKAAFSKSGFQGLRFPDMALFNNKISLIYHGKIFDIEQFFLDNVKSQKSKCEYDFFENRLYIKFVHAEDAATKLFPINVYSKEIEKDSCDTIKLQRNLKYLKSLLSEYTFSTDYLEDGRYTVTEILEKNGFAVARLDNGMDVYLMEYIANNLKEAKGSRSPMALIVDGQSPSNPNYKNVYAEGYPPSIRLSDLVVKIATEKGYEITPSTVFPEPIKVPLVGIKETKARGIVPASFVLCVEWNGEVFNARPNTTAKNAKKNGMFKLKNFDNVYMVVVGTGTYTQKTKDREGKEVEVVHTTVNLNWEIPDTAKNTGKNLMGLKQALSK